MANTKMQLHDWLDDLCSRFIINLPQEELESVERICFQVEEAQWFYEDFIRPLDSSLPHLSLRQFCLLIFQHCPLFAGFSTENHMAAFSEFLTYKTRVPVRGAIMLNDAMDEVVLVKGWKKGANWSFPRGKINKDEKDLDCAVREVYEETGFDISAAGLVLDDSQMKSIEITMRDQHMKLYVFRGVPKDTVFQPRTRKEISKIEWYQLSKLPGWHKKRHGATDAEDTVSANKLYMVAPFLGPLKRWISYQRKLDARQSHDPYETEPYSEGPFIDDRLQHDGNVLPWQYSAPQAVLYPSEYTTMPNVFDQPAHSLANNEQVQDFQADKSAQLKQLLSMQTPTPNTEPGRNAQLKAQQMDQHSANLMSILQQPRTQPLGAASAENTMPQTPLEQIEYQSRQPGPPRHTHPRPPPFSSMPPPPSFPISPSNAPGQNLPAYAIQSSGAGFHNDTPVQGFGQNIPWPASQLQQDDSASQDQTRSSSLGIPQPAVTPYQRTGDHLFNGGSQSLAARQSIVPEPSKLPTPKLSSHAQSLLDVFKGSDTTPRPNYQLEKSTPVQPSSWAAATQALDGVIAARFPRTGPPPNPVYHQTFRQTEADSPENRRIVSSSKTIHGEYAAPGTSSTISPSNVAPWYPGHNHSRTRDHLNDTPSVKANPSQTAPSSSPTDVNKVSSPTSPMPAPAAVKPGSQQDTLLNLFRTPSVASTPLARQPPPSGLSLMPGPVELSAIPSPSLSTQNTQTTQNMSPHAMAAKALSSSVLPASTEPGAVSATVSGPQNIPELGTVRRKQHSTQESSRPFGNPHQPLNAPVKILKRPESGARDVRPSGTIGEDLVSPPSPTRDSKMSTPGLMPPKILKRPQSIEHPSSPKSTGGEPQPFDRRQSTTADQKQTLLSLFSKTKAPDATRTHATPGVISPASVYSEQEGGKEVQTPASALARSRVSSNADEVASHPSEPHISRINSFAADQKEAVEPGNSRRGSATPISPSDRGFLLNYLEGVVKTGR